MSATQSPYAAPTRSSPVLRSARRKPGQPRHKRAQGLDGPRAELPTALARCAPHLGLDRKSTRLNSSHVRISYAVFCLKKKKKKNKQIFSINKKKNINELV